MAQTTWIADLTLTSVVFEYDQDVQNKINTDIFNFNKCCIWIITLVVSLPSLSDLTLTSVVFE